MKNYPEGRIKRVTQERYEKTLKFSTNTFSTKSRFQKTITQRWYKWGNTAKVLK